MDITMGNDEFILYIRKNGKGVGRTTSELGRAIWIWMEDNVPGAIKIQPDQPCRWGDKGTFVDESNLPKTATQFRFDRIHLPRVYNYLDTL